MRDPITDPPSVPADVNRLIAELIESAVDRITQSARLRAATLDHCAEQVAILAEQMAARFTAGGTLYTFGCCDSATDSMALAALFAHPPHGTPLRAWSPASRVAVLAALSRDIGFDVAFARKLIGHATADDMVLGFSADGNSTGLLEAFAQAKRAGLLTIGLTGHDGGMMAASPDVDHCLVVRSDGVHRIQEAQAALGRALWSQVQQQLPAGKVDTA